MKRKQNKTKLYTQLVEPSVQPMVKEKSAFMEKRLWCVMGIKDTEFGLKRIY